MGTVDLWTLSLKWESLLLRPMCKMCPSKYENTNIEKICVNLCLNMGGECLEYTLETVIGIIIFIV